jgi:hypothetical protein
MVELRSIKMKSFFEFQASTYVLQHGNLQKIELQASTSTWEITKKSNFRHLLQHGNLQKKNRISGIYFNMGNYKNRISGIYFNMGNYKGLGDSKFVPDLPKEKFRKIVRRSKAWSNF